MAWTNARRTEWYLQEGQMGMTAAQRISVNAAGIDDPTDCAEIVSAEDWKTVSDIARRHDDGAAPLSARHLKRLQVTSHAMNYYAMVGRPITPANVHYTNQLVRFHLQIDALKKKAKKDDKEPT